MNYALKKQQACKRRSQEHWLLKWECGWISFFWRGTAFKNSENKKSKHFLAIGPLYHFAYKFPTIFPNGEKYLSIFSPKIEYQIQILKMRNWVSQRWIATESETMWTTDNLVHRWRSERTENSMEPMVHHSNIPFSLPEDESKTPQTKQANNQKEIEETK